MAELKVKELAAYIQKKYCEEKQSEISPIKLQKSLYFLFAYWGGFVQKSMTFPNAVEENFSQFNKYLFDEDIEAWVYGPVVPAVYKENDINKFYNKDIFKGKEKLKSFIDDLLKELFEAGDFSLVSASHDDTSWKSKFDYNEKFHNNKMNKEEIIKEYARK